MKGFALLQAYNTRTKQYVVCSVYLCDVRMINDFGEVLLGPVQLNGKMNLDGSAV